MNDFKLSLLGMILYLRDSDFTACFFYTLKYIPCELHRS